MEMQLMKSETSLTAGIFLNICLILISQMDEGNSSLLIVGFLYLEEILRSFIYFSVWFVQLYLVAVG